MKTVWKWVIGVVGVLIILVVLAGVGFMVFSGFHAGRVEQWHANVWPQQGPGQQGPGMMPYNGFGGHMRGPGMMGGYGFGLMPLGGILGGLVCLGFLALLVLGIFWLVNTTRRNKPVETLSGTNAVASTPAAVMDTCKRCGKPIQSDWQNCPYCGKKV